MHHGVHVDARFGVWAPSQRRLDAQRRFSVSCDVVRPSHVLPVPSLPFSEFLACDASFSELSAFLSCYVNVHGVQADGQ